MTFPELGTDKRTGRAVVPDKPVYLRVKALFGTEYPDGATIAVRDGDGTRLVWNAETQMVTEYLPDGTDRQLTRGMVMALRRDEEGWRTPSLAQEVSAPTVGMPIIPPDEDCGCTSGTMTAATANAGHTGAMIALVPSEADLDRLQGDEPREQLHLTLAFLGEAADISPADRDRIILAALPYFPGPVHTDASSVMVLNPHTDEYDTAIVLGMRGMPLVEPRDNVMSAVRGVYSFEETFKPWLPHITMAYSDDLNKVREYVSYLGPITFDKLRFAFGGEVIDITLNDSALAATAFATPKHAEWEGILTLEGTESGDGRMFNLGALAWAQLPQPLMYQPANTGGHAGSVLVGQIRSVNRQGNLVYGSGIVDLDTEYGPEVYRLMNEEMMNGVSVDVDSVHEADIEMTYDPGTLKPRQTRFKRGRIRGATLVAFPAFDTARIYLNGNVTTASADSDVESMLVASSHTITIPDLPPASWFERPTDVKLSGALTVTDDGRVYGLLAPRNTTHRSVSTKVPTRNVDYSRFHKGETIVDGGGRVVTGVLTMNCGHAPTEGYGTLSNRVEHYDNTCSVVANVAIGEHDGEVWVAGALNPFSTPEMVTKMLGCTLSGDWQPHPDRKGIREFIAALLVPVPGFAMARTEASVHYQEGALVASSVPVMRAEDVAENPFKIKEALSIARLNERKSQLSKQLRGDNGM